METSPSFLSTLIHTFKQSKAVFNLKGEAVSNFHSRNSSHGGNFKHNQRKERSLSRRRGMKMNSR